MTTAIESIYKEILERIRAVGTRSGRNLVAFSGGVDSSVAARLVWEAFPGNTTAIIGVSASMPVTQLEMARAIASHIGIPLREIPTTEGELPGYVANEGSSCYHCKTTLYQTMQDFSDALQEDNRQIGGEQVLFNGTNADDLTDPTRVGLQAADAYRVESPLKALPKGRVRALSLHLGLPNWDFAASPCLRSRLQYGVPATPENLRRIEAAEQIVRTMGGLGVKDNLRVRHLEDNIACIEVDEDRIPILSEQLPQIHRAVTALGYHDVSLRPFRSGSLSHLATFAV